jgi:hypothetical protein
MVLVVFGLGSYLVGPGGRGPLRGRVRFAGASRADLFTRSTLRRRGGRSVSLFPGSAGGPADLWVDPHGLAPPPRGAGGGARGLWIDGWEPDLPSAH